MEQEQLSLILQPDKRDTYQVVHFPVLAGNYFIYLVDLAVFAGGHLETFKFLLKRGARVCAALNGVTVLMEAVDKNKVNT